MSDTEQQVLHTVAAWPRRFYLVAGVVFTALGLIATIEDPADAWRGWGRLVLGLVWLALARAANLRFVLSPAGVSRQRYLGGFTDIPWSSVEHVGDDARTPAFRTGGEIRLAGGRQLAFRGWSEEGVQRARAWWQAGQDA